MIIDVNFAFKCDLDFAYFISLRLSCRFFSSVTLNQSNLQLFLTNFKMTRTGNFELCDVIFAQHDLKIDT